MSEPGGQNAAELPALILCGGRGTRAYPHTIELPKPLLEVAQRPILGHVIEIFARQGFRRFVLAAGFQAHLISEFASTLPPELDVDVVDTGLDADTGERVWRCQDRLGARFFVTYGDGVGDVDLAALVAHHASRRALATVTTVPLPSQYGTVQCDGDGWVSHFVEKPVLPDHWINAGFLVMEGDVFASWRGTNLEREVLPALAEQRHLVAYRHRGFWKSMDTYKDALDLTALAGEGHPPWLPARQTV